MVHFIPIDYIFLAIIVLFAVIALIKGFIQEVFGKASWVCAILCAILFYAKLSVVLNASISSKILCNTLAFLLIFIVVFVVIKLIGQLISKLCQFSVIKGLDKALGLFFGILEGFAIVALLIFLLGLQTFFSTETLLDGSFFYNIIGKFLENPEVQEAITHV